MSKKEFPNCAICKWFRQGDIIRLSLCRAQGGLNTLEAYNNKQCKIIFEKIQGGSENE